MNAQLELQFGRKLKERGRAAAAAKRNPLLMEAQDAAWLCALHNSARECSANDVAEVLADRGIDYDDLGPAAGSIFRGSDWVFTGRWIESIRSSRHAGMIRIWRLR